MKKNPEIRVLCEVKLTNAVYAAMDASDSSSKTTSGLGSNSSGTTTISPATVTNLSKTCQSVTAPAPVQTQADIDKYTIMIEKSCKPLDDPKGLEHKCTGTCLLLS